ncbi:MAG: hypothetical protein M1461_01445 [Nitrospirae bacterium]|nr:hypothetical protein [Nitrospirota bacterium]
MIDLDEFGKFISKYNHYEGKSSSRRFLHFYSDILDCLTGDRGLIDDTLEIIEMFIKRIRIIDDLIDDHKIPIEIAFPLIFPEIEASVEGGQFELESCKMRLLSEAAATSLVLKEQSDKKLLRYQDRGSLDSELLKNKIAAIYAYGLREISLDRSGVCSVSELEAVLSEYNCDFHLYNTIAFDLVLNERVENRNSLLNFLHHYVVIDGILDSFCDLFDDIEKRSFNFLLTLGKKNYSNNIRKSLFFSGVYELFFQIAEKHYKSAQESLGTIENDILGQRLKRFLNGAWLGISIAKDNCFFADSDPLSVDPIEQVLYKPYPWEIVEGSRVLRHVSTFMSNVEHEIQTLKERVSERDWVLQEGDELKAVEKYYQSIKDKSLNKDIIILRTKGCQKALTHGNKCNHCGISKSYYTSAAFRQDTLDAFKIDFSMIDADSMNQLGIYCLGSFFDENEVDEEIRQYVYETIRCKNRKMQFVFESRPEFITDRTIGHLRTFLPDHEIAVGFGFDAKCNFIRNVILNKTISLEHVESAVNVLKKYKLRSIGYVSLKPPFLTECQSIFEAIRTGRYLQSIGVDYVSIEPIAIQMNTIQATLAKNGYYNIPWLWSSIEVCKALCMTGKVLFGGQTFLPIPIQTAKNCEKCTGRILHKMKNFNLCQDTALFNGETCDCLTTYLNTIEQERHSRTFHPRFMEADEIFTDVFPAHRIVLSTNRLAGTS